LASNRRFSFCRALFPLLIKQTAKSEMHLVTSSHSPIQQAGRAFAAEFLAPRKVVAGKLGQLKNDYDRVDDVAKRFGVSSLVIEHQYDNLLRGSQSPAAHFNSNAGI
jgi:Zn-dependent peptidase ImmA (M78 family)